MTHVLIVDDKPQNLYLLRTLLQASGCSVDEAHHGAEALVKARQTPPDVLVSDILMPVMDGYTLLRHWRADERLRQIPFVIYTATYTEPNDERLALDLGASAFIVKPAEPELFMAHILQVLEQQQHGALPAGKVPGGEAKDHFKEYSETLVRKLEEKAVQLEQANRALRQDNLRRQQAEHALRESEERLRLALDAAHMGTFDWDIPNNHITWSRWHEELWDFKPGEFGGTYQAFAARVHPDDLPGIDAQVAACIATRMPFVGEFRVIWTDASIHWIAARGEFSYDATGRPLRMRGVVREVTARKETEAALLQNERLLSESQRIAQIGSWSCELASNQLHWSDETYRLYGVIRSEFVPTPESFLRLIHPADQAAMQNWVQACLAGAAPGELEFRVLMSSGATRLLRGRGYLRHDDAKRAVEMIGTVQDITERSRIEAEKQRLESQLQQAQKMEVVGQLTAGIAHDFNNILASVLGYTSLALDQHVPDKTSKLASCLHQVETAGLRARDLITNMLAFSRASASTQQAVPLGLLAQEVAKLLLPTLPSNIAFTTCVDTDQATVLADPAQLHQVIMNLVINARDAVAADGRIELLVRAASAVNTVCSGCHADIVGDFVELSVSDNGTGIPADILPHIFEPFYTTKGIGKGTGMGMSVVHGVVHGCGGHVVVTSAPGTGTLIRVLLPWSGVSPAVDAATATELAAHGNGNHHILVVDDEEVLAKLIGEVLGSYGYRVTVFGDSRQALENFRAAPATFDALVSDQTMPGLTGIELAKAVRSLRPGLPIILLTGYNVALNADVAARLGVGFLSKPISFDALRLTLGNLLPGA